MANKNQDAKRSRSKKGACAAGENCKKREKTQYQKERDAAKVPRRKHNRDPFNSTRGI